MNTKEIFNKFLILTSIISFASGCSPVLFPVNVSIPIDISKEGSIAESEFNLWRDDQYEIELEFISLSNFAPNDKKLIDYLGGIINRTSGVTIPVQVIIAKINNENEIVVLNKEFQTKGISSVGEKFIIRNVTMIRLNSGKYKIKIINKNSNNELREIRVNLIIHYFRR